MKWIAASGQLQLSVDQNDLMSAVSEVLQDEPFDDRHKSRVVKSVRDCHVTDFDVTLAGTDDDELMYEISISLEIDVLDAAKSNKADRSQILFVYETRTRELIHRSDNAKIRSKIYRKRLRIKNAKSVGFRDVKFYDSAVEQKLARSVIDTICCDLNNP